MRTVLIAGATGYLGRQLVKKAHEAGYKVNVLVRNPDKLNRGGPALSPTIGDFVNQVFVGDVTRPETLDLPVASADIVVSTVSMMAQLGKHSWHEIDYLGNLNLLRAAEKQSVQKFVYFSVFQGQALRHVPMVDAHERFAEALTQSTIPHTIIRPTGYYSDLAEILNMAKGGRVYLLGDGTARINPIHGADLAQKTIELWRQEGSLVANVGGPQTYTWDEIAELAFSALGEKAKISHLPTGLAQAFIKVMKPFFPQRAALWDFFVSSTTVSLEAPSTGSKSLGDFYKALAQRSLANA